MPALHHLSPAGLRGHLALALCLIVAACGGGGDAAAPATTPAARIDDPAAVTRLQWATAAPLFTASGQQQPLQVQALGAQGQVLNVPVSWQSSAPAVVGVAAPVAGTTGEAATLTSATGTGTAVVTATVGSRSLSAVAVVAGVAAGTVVLTDAQVSGEPQATAPAAPLRVGSTYTVTLQPGVTAPTVGQRVLGRGSKGIAGEVVAVNGQVLTLALVPLQRLLPQLQLDLDLPLQAAPARATTADTGRRRALAADGVRPLASTSFSVAGFDCDAEGSAGGVELAKKDVTPTGLDSLRYRVLWNSQRQMLRLSGQPGVQFELEPTAKLAFTGKVDCKLELADLPIPLPPAIGLFLGVGFPVGVGFTLEGALPINGVALNLKGQAQADVVVGFDCNPGCASLNSLQTGGSVTPTVTAPDFTANRLELTGQVYAWANFEGGARWSSTLQFDAIEAQAGLKFATAIGTENAQAQDAASAGQYALSFEASVAPTEALGDFADLVGLILDKAKLETSVPLGRSPTATLALDKSRFKAGDDVKFTVDLTAAEVLFPLQGYNVQAVRVYRKTTAADGSFVLVLAGEQAASSGQTQFVIPWLATVDSGSDIGFVAFVQTQLLSGLRWQVGLADTQAPASTRYALVAKPGGGNFDKTECVADRQSGLVWEGKPDSGVRSGVNVYFNVLAGTAAGWDDASVNSDSNSVGYVTYVNSIALCGYTNWRMPSIEELESLLDTSVDPAAQAGGLMLPTAWFPNTPYVAYTSATVMPLGGNGYFTYALAFTAGVRTHADRFQASPIRLVR